jgi:hypothetical protein
MLSVGEMGNVPADFLLDSCNRWRPWPATNALSWLNDDLFDQCNDRPPYLRVADTTERQGERDTIRCSEKFNYVRG